MIDDGTYDVFIVDAVALPDDDATSSDSPGWRLELTILSGQHKGDVVSVNAAGLSGSEFDLIGMPGTLRVVDGNPSFRVDA